MANTPPPSPAISRPPTDARRFPTAIVAMCQMFTHVSADTKQPFFQTCVIHTPANHRGQANWQIPLRQSWGRVRTAAVGALQLIFGEQHCAGWGWFVSMCLVWSSAVTMAWRAAKGLLTLIAANSYVRVVLAGGTYDTKPGCGADATGQMGVDSMSLFNKMCNEITPKMYIYI